MNKIISFLIFLFIFPSSVYSEYKKPNIILITIDALRPDHLGCYGYERNTSPNIDRLAKEGVIFTQAIAQSCWSYPSIFSILTSTYPSTHGVLSPSHNLKEVPLLSQILKENGYYTVAICAHYTISEVKKLRDSFNKFFSFKGEEDNFWIVNNAQEVTKIAKKWLRNNYKRRFFLWIHYMDCHGPYKPPSPYDKMWIKEQFNKLDHLSVSEHLWLGLGGVPKYMSKFMDIEHMSKENYISQYDGEISFVDNQIGFLLDELKKLGVEKKTIIILTSDHGESLGEHNYFGHELLLYDNLLKVPLIIKCPHIFSSNKIITKQVRSIDIMPTILDILNLKQPDIANGKSLIPLIQGKENFHVLYAFSSYENYLKRYSIRSEEWKLIYTKESDKYELYNLKKDPQELANLYGKETAIAEEFKKELEKYLNKSLLSNKTSGEINKDTEEILRNLGYLQ